MTISDFIVRCDSYCAATGKSRVWLSKALLADTYRLDHLAEGRIDIGVKRLERAASDLATLESQIGGAEASPATQGTAA